MRPINKILVSSLVSFLIVSSFGVTIGAINYGFYWDKDVVFNLSSYGTYIIFNEDFFLGEFSFVNGTQITFTDILFDNNVDLFKVTTRDCNMTILQLSDSALDYNVTGLGNQTVYLENKTPTSIIVDGVVGVIDTDYTYSDGLTTVSSATSSVNMTFNSDSEISMASGRGSASGLFFFVFVIALALIVLLLFYGKE